MNNITYLFNNPFL